jgi:hypothetical protein
LNLYTSKVQEIGIDVIVSFASPDLAKLCNSREHLARLWGADIADAVGRRLCDLAAADAATLEQLPGVAVELATGGRITLTVAHRIVLQGRLHTVAPTAHQADVEHILIDSVAIYGSDPQ